MATGLEKSIFIPILKKDNAKVYWNYCIITLISHASKVMLKIHQARLQQCIEWELPDVQTWFRKGRGTRDQIANIRCIIGIEFQKKKKIYFCFTDYIKIFDCVHLITNWKILQEMHTHGKQTDLNPGPRDDTALTGLPAWRRGNSQTEEFLLQPE